MQVIENHIVKNQKIPIRIQEYAVGIFKTCTTKSAIKKAIRKNLILVDNHPVTTAKIIFGGEKISLLKPQNSISKKQFDFKLNIVYEDDYLAVIEKPSGILVSGNQLKTVDNALQQNLKKSTQFDAVRPRPVHRLDFLTSGLLLIGKTSSSIIALNQLFENKKIEKTYHAITIGRMEPEGCIDTEIDHKHAISNYRVIFSVKSERFVFLNLVELTPKTGRRHQLRKHMLSIGNPILGDQVYGIDSLLLKGKGLYLHASNLQFKHPFTNEKLSLKLSLPPKFLKIKNKVLLDSNAK